MSGEALGKTLRGCRTSGSQVALSPCIGTSWAMLAFLNLAVPATVVLSQKQFQSYKLYFILKLYLRATDVDKWTGVFQLIIFLMFP